MGINPPLDMLIWNTISTLGLTELWKTVLNVSLGVLVMELVRSATSNAKDALGTSQLTVSNVRT